MDAIDLLLIASKSEPSSAAADHLDAVNAILSLASTSKIELLPPHLPKICSEIDDNQLSAKSDVNLTGSPPERTRPMRRPRAMSEPWTTDYVWQSPVGRNANSAVNRSSYLTSGSLRSAKDELQNIAIATIDSGPATSLSPATLTAMEKYSSIYNKNGRIGIYTKDERAAIIRRYRDKKKRRVWKKQIRYYCRKNLADRRIRIKGRFVKANEMHLFAPQGQALLGAGPGGQTGVASFEAGSGRGGKLGYLVDVLGHIDEEEEEEEEEDDLDDEDLALPPLPTSTQRRVRRHSIAY